MEAPKDAVFRAFSSLGGETGWLCMNWAWKIRGAIDRLLGGVGLRKGRRDPKIAAVGDMIDFWFVAAMQPGHMMRLRAEMKVPGRAWLQFRVSQAVGCRCSMLTQITYFAPNGLPGIIYWYALYPIHAVIFGGMIRKLATRAEALSRSTNTPQRL